MTSRVIQRDSLMFGSDTPTDKRGDRTPERDTGDAKASPAASQVLAAPSTADRALTSESGTSRLEADVDITVPEGRTTAQARADIYRLQELLATAIDQREHLVNANLELYRRSRHWFVDDGNGYCQACNTPARNTSRHTARRAA
jgi:hypothetical protein